MTRNLDPITVSVVSHRLTAIVEEMGEAMLRTAYSQILNSLARLFGRDLRPRLPAGRAGRTHSRACRRDALGGQGGFGPLRRGCA